MTEKWQRSAPPLRFPSTTFIIHHPSSIIRHPSSVIHHPSSIRSSSFVVSRPRLLLRPARRNQCRVSPSQPARPSLRHSCSTTECNSALATIVHYPLVRQHCTTSCTAEHNQRRETCPPALYCSLSLSLSDALVSLSQRVAVVIKWIVGNQSNLR